MRRAWPRRPPALQDFGAAWSCASALVVIQFGFDIAHHVEQPWANVADQPAPAEVKRWRPAIKGEDARPVRGNERHSHRGHVALPVSDRERKSAAGEILSRALDAEAHLG